MLPRPVAATPKETIAPRAAQHVQAAHAGFTKFLGDDMFLLTQSGKASGSSSVNAGAAPPAKPKSRNDNADATAAAMQQPPAQPAQAQPTAAQAGAPQGTSAAAVQGNQTLIANLPSAAAAGADATNPDGTPQNGSATSAPPGAADVEARVTVGVPAFLSQSLSTFAGLWHHAADATAQKSDAPQSDEDANQPASVNASASTAKQTLTEALLQAHGHNDDGADDDAPAKTDAAQAAPATDPSQTPTPLTLDAASANTGDKTVAPAAPMPAPAAPAHVLPVYEQVAVTLKQAAQNGTDSIQIQLKPASLGAIEVKLDVTHDGKISAVISADRSDTLNMLQQDSSGLEQALRDAGLQADSGSLSFNLRGDGQSFAQNSSSSSAWGGGFDDHSGSTTTDRPQTQAIRRHRGALDIEV
jgi:flagellar hook-length control protein FliK